MSEYSDQRDAIVAIVEGVSGAGRVHDRPRWGDARSLWVTTIDDIEQIRAWELGLRDPGQTEERLTQAHVHTYRHWQLRAWFSLIEPQNLLGEGAEGLSEYDKDWVGDNYVRIIELGNLIKSALNADRDLTNTCLDMTLPPQMSQPEALTIGGGHLCWSLTIDFDAYTINAT